MKIKNIVMLVMLVMLVIFTGCSSKYTYHIEPTPLRKGETLYRLGNVNVNLSLGYGGIENDSRFANAQELTDSFKEDINMYLEKENLLATDDTHADAIVDLNIFYTRRFNYGGNCLNKPLISYKASIRNKEGVLASYMIDEFTTKYAYFDDLAVNLEIATYNWDAEDEPRDIDVVSKIIVQDIAGLGK